MSENNTIEGRYHVAYTPQNETDARMICVGVGDSPDRRVDCCCPDGVRFGTVAAWTMDAAKRIPSYGVEQAGAPNPWEDR